jgi:hypothetical protein
MTATNKRLLISGSHGDSNRCTPYRGKPDQHDMYASHVSPRTTSVRFLWVVPVRDNLSQGANIFGQIPLLPRKRAPDTIPARWLTNPRVRTQLLSQASQRNRGVSQAPDDDQLLGLPGPQHRHAIGTFNTCSRRPTERSLINTCGGYNLGGAGLPHTTP